MVLFFVFVVSIVQCLSGLNVGVVDFSNTNRAILFYPNPIMERATLQYTLNKPEAISVSLTDIQGRLITCFFSNQKQAAGSYEKTISLPENLPNGVYCIVISTKNKQIVVKVIK